MPTFDPNYIIMSIRQWWSEPDSVHIVVQTIMSWLGNWTSGSRNSYRHTLEDSPSYLPNHNWWSHMNCKKPLDHNSWPHQPAALFFKRTTIASLIRETLANQNNKFSYKQFDLFFKYLFRPILVLIFAAVKASLVVIYIIVVNNIIFMFLKQSSEGVTQSNFS